ncbi:hypothetical protein DWUX_2419 [Desulfovibrio diazotrophicus]|nr:hypothetical protein DWUX_2419 [Desulfovibrio diazotrophicus]
MLHRWPRLGKRGGAAAALAPCGAPCGAGAFFARGGGPTGLDQAFSCGRRAFADTCCLVNYIVF